MTKYGGKNFSTEDGEKVGPADAGDMFVTADGKLKAGKNPWNAKSSGHGYNGERWNDDKGYERGTGAYADDDKAFRKASNTRDDGDNASTDIFNEVLNNPMPAGNQLGGGGPVREVSKRGK